MSAIPGDSLPAKPSYEGFMTQDSPAAGKCAGYGGTKHPIPCRKAGAIEYNGKMFCEWHHPPTAAKAVEEQIERDRPEMEAYQAKMAKRIADGNELKRKGRAYDALLVELSGKHSMFSAGYLFQFLRDAK